MLIFPLKKEWYEKIRSGYKRIEYREIKPYWTKRIANLTGDKVVEHDGRGKVKRIIPDNSFPCVLRLGYTKRQMTAEITKIEVVDGKDTDLRVDKPVYAIHFVLVSGVENETI